MKESVFKRVWLLASIAAMFVMVALTPVVAQENPAIKEARQLQFNDQPTKAISVLNEAIKANPTDASLLYNLGRAQILAKTNMKDAEITFQKGLDVNAKEALNLAGKGHLRMVEGNATEAKTFFDQALSATKSKNASVLRAVAEGYITNAKFANDAIALLTKAKSIDNDPFTYILLGDAYAKLAKGGDAVSSYEKAASLDPKSGVPHYKIGVVYLRSKNYSVAEESLLKAISIDPNTALAHKELGELYYSTKKSDKAVKAYQSYLSLTEFKDDAQGLLAFMYFMNKEYDKANEIFKTLIAKPTVSVTTLKYYAYSLVEAGKIQEATAAFDNYFAKAKPEDITADVYIYVAKNLQKQGLDSLAVVYYRKSLELEKNSEIASTVAEIFYEKLKKYDEAIVAYDEVKAIRGKLGAKESYNLGRAALVEGELLKADSAFADLAESNPNITTGHAWRGRTQARIDSTDTPKFLAQPYFEKVLEIAEANPSSPKADQIEALEYMGYYYDTKGDFAKAKATFEKLRGLDPANAKAKAYLDAMKQSQQQRAQQKKNGGR